MEIGRGEVHALVGENGAGKSTLMKILTGQYNADEGSILLFGKNVKIDTPAESLKLGLSIIQQELSPLLDMTVAENLFIGREIKVRGVLDKKGMLAKTAKILAEYNLQVDPRVKVRTLNIAQKQMLEIIKAVSYNSQIVIMDEPTSSLTDKEVTILFDTIRSLKEKGISVIYISHRLEEIFEIADRVTVFRDGMCVGSSNIADVTPAFLITQMVGREVENIFPKVEVEIAEEIFAVKDFGNGNKFSDINFSLRRGEILGFSGLMGAGRSEVMRSIFGLDPHTAGEVYLEGKKLTINSPKDAIEQGIGYLSEDRKELGLVLTRSVKENISLATLGKFNRGIKLNKKSELDRCCQISEKLQVKTPTLQTRVNSLSGGNQQKVVLAKWLLAKPKVLILDEPTRGIDVGAKAEIHKLMCELAAEGMAIIMISSELPEVMSMSDRLVVMGNGRIKSVFSREEIKCGKVGQEEILKVAIGG
jgi:ABC-type sugar transport system ATPase subunit